MGLRRIGAGANARTGCGSQSNCFQDVSGPSDATVKVDLEVGHGPSAELLQLVHNLDEHLDARSSEIELTAAVVGKNDTLTTCVDRFHSVL